jgi:hypothetical protein
VRIFLWIIRLVGGYFFKLFGGNRTCFTVACPSQYARGGRPSLPALKLEAGLVVALRSTGGKAHEIQRSGATESHA